MHSYVAKEGQVANLQLHSLYSSWVFWGLTKAAEEMTSQDCLEHAKISAGRGFCWERRDLIFVTRLLDFPFSSFKIKTISSCICLFPKTTTFKTRLISQKALFLHFYSIPATQELFPSFFVETRQKCKTWQWGSVHIIQTFGQDSRLSSLGHFG